MTCFQISEGQIQRRHDMVNLMTLQQSLHFSSVFLSVLTLLANCLSCCSTNFISKTLTAENHDGFLKFGLVFFSFVWLGGEKKQIHLLDDDTSRDFFVYHLNLVRTQKWRIPCFSRWSLFATENRWWSLMEVDEVDLTQFSGETPSIFGTWSYCERNSSYKHHSIWAWTLWAQTIFSNVDLGLRGKNTIIFQCLCWSYRPPSPSPWRNKSFTFKSLGPFPKDLLPKKEHRDDKLQNKPMPIGLGAYGACPHPKMPSMSDIPISPWYE